MKTITARKLQQQLAHVLKEVAVGEEYQLTFRGRPIVKLSPADSSEMHTRPKPPKPGSYEAFLESLHYIVETGAGTAAAGQQSQDTLHYKELRIQLVEGRHGS